MTANLRRVRMRTRLAAKHWNEFIENFEQIIMEGYGTQEVKDEFRRLQARSKSMQKIVKKIMKVTKEYEKDDQFPC